MICFKIRTETIDLCQLLKAAGLCPSGGEAKIAIAEGLVTLNGTVETRKAKKIRAGDQVAFNGETISVES